MNLYHESGECKQRPECPFDIYGWLSSHWEVSCIASLVGIAGYYVKAIPINSLSLKKLYVIVIHFND